MFSRISLTVCAVYLVLFLINQIFGAGIQDFYEWFKGVAFGIAVTKILDFVLTLEPKRRGILK